MRKPTRTVEELLTSAPAPDTPPRMEPEEERPRPSLFGDPIVPRPRARPSVRLRRRMDGKRH